MNPENQETGQDEDDQILRKLIDIIISHPKLDESLEEAGQYGTRSEKAVTKIHTWLKTSEWWERLVDESENILEVNMELWDKMHQDSEAVRQEAYNRAHSAMLGKISTMAASFFLMGMTTATLMHIDEINLGRGLILQQMESPEQ